MNFIINILQKIRQWEIKVSEENDRAIELQINRKIDLYCIRTGTSKEKLLEKLSKIKVK